MVGNTVLVCHYEASKAVNWDHIKIFLDIYEPNAKCCIYIQNVVFIDCYVTKLLGVYSQVF